MMTVRRQWEIVLFLFMVLAISVTLLVRKNIPTQTIISSPIVMPFVAPTMTPTPIPEPTPQLTDIPSSDGSKTLHMKQTVINGSIDYVFSTTAKTDATEIPIFAKTVAESTPLSVPFNSWSPDNNYFFLKEDTSTIPNYYIFSASGKALTQDTAFINLTEAFQQKYPDWKIEEVTGWAAPNLLILNVVTEKNETPSLWFDIYGKSFIRLSTKFY